MRYFKNIELVHLYGISDKAVRNWIESSQQEKNELELFNDDGRIYIADTIKNSVIIQELVEQGKKYRNRRSHRTVKPNARFYELYTLKQVVDVINSIEKHSEFPNQYRFIDEGGRYWDAYLHKLYGSSTQNTLKSTIRMLELEWPNIKLLASQYDLINIVDIGVGNGLAVKELLVRLKAIGKLGRYIGIDSSKELLDITEQNIHEWLGNDLVVEKHIRDINYERFDDVTLNSGSSKEPGSSINIFLFLGGTIGNFRDPMQALNTIHHSMSKQDILISSVKLDSDNARRFFDFNLDGDRAVLPLFDKFILELLSIDKSLYDVEQFFAEAESARRIHIRLKVDLSIQFEIKGITKTVHLEKGSVILLVRMWEWSDYQFISLYEKANFSQMRMLKSADDEYILLVSKVGSAKPQHPSYARIM